MILLLLNKKELLKQSFSDFEIIYLYSSKIKFKPRQLHLAVLKYSLRLAS
ncbi:DNA/RNA helicase (DEAD/DEAH Box family) [Streptococcus mitis]|uniref:DNA/RNA helicase (DEAD/DEAH Box family) n=1 Tax=Streptococcus mitis TaxID=28037 RepID=A0A139PR88_STRMT|nr:DNA/RNA helicase (DEAD/DEAH Box family) [Streptococcus mitis]